MLLRKPYGGCRTKGSAKVGVIVMMVPGGSAMRPSFVNQKTLFCRWRGVWREDSSLETVSPAPPDVDDSLRTTRQSSNSRRHPFCDILRCCRVDETPIRMSILSHREIKRFYAHLPNRSIYEHRMEAIEIFYLPTCSRDEYIRRRRRELMDTRRRRLWIVD